MITLETLICSFLFYALLFIGVPIIVYRATLAYLTARGRYEENELKRAQQLVQNPTSRQKERYRG